MSRRRISFITVILPTAIIILTNAHSSPESVAAIQLHLFYCLLFHRLNVPSCDRPQFNHTECYVRGNSEYLSDLYHNKLVLLIIIAMYFIFCIVFCNQVILVRFCKCCATLQYFTHTYMCTHTKKAIKLLDMDGY